MVYACGFLDEKDLWNKRDSRIWLQLSDARMYTNERLSDAPQLLFVNTVDLTIL